jgi:hypothetical protein
MATNKVTITETSNGNFSIKSKIQKVMKAWSTGKFFNYSLFLSFLVCAILMWLVFNLPANTKLFGFYKSEADGAELAFTGIVAIILFCAQAFSNIHYIVRYSIDKTAQKRVGYLVFFSLVFAMSSLLLIFGLTNKPSMQNEFASWIYGMNWAANWFGFEYTAMGYVFVSIMSVAFILTIAPAYLILIKGIKISKKFTSKPSK